VISLAAEGESMAGCSDGSASSHARNQPNPSSGHAKNNRCPDEGPLPGRLWSGPRGKCRNDHAAHENSKDDA
jgi:hypothetical protein